MKTEDKTLLRSKIESTIVQLEADLPLLAEQAKPVAPDNAIGRLTRMEAISSRGIAEANLRNAKNRLSRLKVMLTKIEEDEFGHCRQCDDPIPLGRLLAVPGEDLCIECAE